MPYALCPMPYALCPMPYALCPMPYALCPMPYALCPMPYALCTSEHVTEKGYSLGNSDQNKGIALEWHTRQTKSILI